MKTRYLFLIIIMSIAIMACECKGQPNSDYEISNRNSQGNLVTIAGAVKYHFFLEKADTNSTQLIQGMDYKMLGDLTLRKGDNNIPSFTINLLNDESVYVVGIVAENVAGIYGGMGVASNTVAVVPGTPAGVSFKRK